MSNDLRAFSNAARAVFTDPKCVAQIQWLRDYGICAQLDAQWPRAEQEMYLATGQHADPDRRISLRFEEVPDFDWWEPRYDQPGRREQSRYRELGLL